MRILVLVDRYIPDVSGTAIRTKSLIEPIAQMAGWRLHVSTINACTFESQVEDAQLPVEELINGVYVHRYESMHHLIAQLPHLYRREKFDVVHARGSRLAFYALMALSAYRVPVVLELNYLFPQSSPVKLFLWRRTLQWVRRIIVLSESARGWLQKEMQVDPASIDVIVNGINIERFMPSSGQEIRNEIGICDDSVVVGYLGTFWYWQGVFELVKSAALVVKKDPRVRYLMVGDGPDLAGIQQLVSQIGLADLFIFTGSVPPNMVPHYLAAMDIFVLARPKMLLNELVVPLKLLEAMAMELPVIVSDLPALTEIINNGKNGVVAEPDPKSIALSTLRLAENETLMAALGKTARQTVVGRFSWDLAVGKLIQTYELAAGKKQS